MYQTLARGGPGLILGFCWSHARREFVEAERFYPQCSEVLDLMGDLFAVERPVPDPDRLSGDDDRPFRRDATDDRERSMNCVNARGRRGYSLWSTIYQPCDGSGGIGTRCP